MENSPHDSLAFMAVGRARLQLTLSFPHFKNLPKYCYLFQAYIEMYVKSKNRTVMGTYPVPDRGFSSFGANLDPVPKNYRLILKITVYLYNICSVKSDGFQFVRYP
jgi:hypothetical protein